MNFKLSRLVDCDGDITKRWYVYFLFRDPESNDWVRFTRWISTKCVTKQQRYDAAKELRKSIDLKLKQGWNPFVNQNRGLTTVNRCVDHFLANRESYVRKRTNNTYKCHLKIFKLWCIKNKFDKLSIESINYYMASDFMDHVASKKVSNRTWNNYLQSLRTCFNFLIAKEYIMVNPFFKLHDRPTEQPELIAFSRDELKVISNNLPSYNHDLYVIALLIFNCFLRPQEIVRLQVKHLKELGRNFTIPGSVSKNKKNETISVTNSLLSEVQKMDLNFPDDWFVFGLHMKRAKKQVAPTRIAEEWKEFATLYNLSKSIYALKHTGNGLALEGGANARDIQLQNRHSSLEETQKYLDRFSRIPSDQFLNALPKL